MNPSTSHDTHHYVQAPQERDASETSLEHDVNIINILINILLQKKKSILIFRGHCKILSQHMTPFSSSSVGSHLMDEE